MASPLSDKFLTKVSTYATKNYGQKAMGFSPHQRLRIMIAEQLFQAYATNRVPMTRMPIKVVPAIAARVYRMILENASTDADMAELRDACGIVDGLKRSYGELTNDIQVYDVLTAAWGTDTSHHDKAVVKEAAYALIELGHEQGNERALAAGADRLSKLNNDFQEAAEDFARTASTEIDIIADVRLIRPDAENVSRAAIDEFKRKYGAYLDKKEGVEKLLVNDQEPAPLPSSDDDDDTTPSDFFEAMEPDI